MERNDVLKILSDIAKVERTPEELDALVLQLAKTLPSSFIQEEQKNILAEDARHFTPQGYEAFYRLIHGHAPPHHILEREVKPIIESDIGTIVFAWRGSWKTVSISVTLLSWFIGLFPEKSNLVVCASDDNAKKITTGVADIIMYHPEFKRAFPYVIPNEKGKWSLDGFSVIDTRDTPEAWAQKQAAAIDPTFVGGGYDSQRLNGKHPTGLLICDDLHNEKNSASEKLRQEVVDVVLKVILKTAVKNKDELVTRIVFIGTPWADDDVNYVLKNTGEFNFINIPAASRTVEGDGIYCDGKSRDGMVYDDIVGWWNFTWSDGYGVKSFITDRATLGIKSFWQMIMLDLATASTGKLRYYEYPVAEVRYDLPTVGGADPTTFTASEGHTSHYALAYLSKLPTGGAVVVGGILEQCTMTAAENHILYAQGKFQNWLYTAVENVGVGKVFLQSCYKNPRLIVIPSGLKDITDGTVKNKHDRVLSMHKHFEDGTVRISNEDTPFLNALRRLFDKFWDLDVTDPAFDAADAVYHALKNMPDVLFKEEEYEFVKKRSTSPMTGINRFSGYGR